MKPPDKSGTDRGMPAAPRPADANPADGGPQKAGELPAAPPPPKATSPGLAPTGEPPRPKATVLGVPPPPALRAVQPPPRERPAGTILGVGAPEPLALAPLGPHPDDPLDLPPLEPLATPLDAIVGEVPESEPELPTRGFPALTAKMWIALGTAGALLALALIVSVAVLASGGDEQPAAEATPEPDVRAAAGPRPSSPPDQEGPSPAADRSAPLPAMSPAAQEEFDRVREEAREHFGADRFEQAAAGYRRATELDPTHAGSFAGLGAALAAMDDNAGAVTAYARAVELAPEHSGFFAALGRVLLATGERERAVAAYERAIELDPRNRAARAALRELR